MLTKTSTLLAAILLAAMSATGGALAAPQAAEAQAAAPTLSVAYADLDLRDPKDAATMLKRIRKAAGALCTDRPGFVGNDPDTVRRIDECFRRSVARAVEGLNAPRVTAVYAGKPDRAVLAGLR